MQRFYDIFVSYHPAQQTEVQHYCEQLNRRCGLRLYLNASSSYGARSFDASIDALQDSLLFVCFFSSDYARSLRCRVEFSTAAEQGMPLLSMILNPFVLSDADNTFFRLRDQAIYTEVRLYEESAARAASAFTVSPATVQPAHVELIQQLIDYQIKNKQSYKNYVSACFD